MAERAPVLNPGHLPDFCRAPLVFSAMVIAELAVIIAMVSPGRFHVPGLAELGLASLLVQWLTLVCVALCCVGRGLLSRLGRHGAWFGAWVLVTGTTAGLTAVVGTVDRVGIVSVLPAGLGVTGFVVRTSLVVSLVSAAFLRYLWVLGRWHQGQQAQSQARINALQARIRPHFLFNTLNTIAALVPDRPQAAERAIENLSDLFRGSLREADAPVTLDEELELVRKYLDIEGLRLGDRLDVAWSLDGWPEALRVPPFSLQLLVENAIQHGIQPRPDGGRITIGARPGPARACLEVTNPVAPPSKRPAGGIALDNLRQRLALIYGSAARLRTFTRDERFHAVIEWETET